MPDPEAIQPSSARKRIIFGVIVIVVLAVGAQQLRQHLDIEWSAESIQETVARAGVLAPLGFIALVLIRQLLAIPSVLVLTSAGLLFGAPLGALIGGVGISLNALLIFAMARFMGRDWILPRVERRYPDFERRAMAAGPFLVFVMTAHPMGVLTPIYLAAGVTRMKLWVFLLSLIPAALFRAGCYAFLGAYLLEPGSPRFWSAMAVLLMASILPLTHPGFRRRLFGLR